MSAIFHQKYFLLVSILIELQYFKCSYVVKFLSYKKYEMHFLKVKPLIHPDHTIKNKTYSLKLKKAFYFRIKCSKYKVLSMI